MEEQEELTASGGTHPTDLSGSDAVSYPPYSVLMSVYAKENPAYFRESIGSMTAQSVPPEQIVVVEDGPLPQALKDVIINYSEQYPHLFTVLSLPVNGGSGKAAACGMKVCRNEIVARMDSDDYSFPDRMEKELSLMQRDHLDMVGSQVVEFVTDPHHPITRSDLPLAHNTIVSFSKKRDPFHQPSVVFKKSAVLAAGNYSSDFLYFEDWELFNRMLARGAHAENIDEALVAMRVSPDFYERRGGLSYIPHIWRFKTSQLKNGYFSFPQFIVTTIPHIIVCLVPNKLRSWIYTNLLRKKVR